MAKLVVTPVEERIDHEEAKRIAATLLTMSRYGVGDVPRLKLEKMQNLARAYLDLLTEHSARERERDAFADALEHERSLNKSVVAPLRTAVAELLNGGMNASRLMASHDRDAYRRFLSTYRSLPATEPAQPEQEVCRYCGQDAEEQDALGRWACPEHVAQIAEDVALVAQPEEKPNV